MKKIFILLLLAAGAGFILSRAGDRGVLKEGEPEKGTHYIYPSDGETSSSDRDSEHVPSSAGGVADSETRAQLSAAAVPSHSEKVSDGKAFSFVLSQPRGDESCEDIYKMAVSLAESNELAEARRLLTGVYLAGTPGLREKAGRELDKINAKLVFDPTITQGAIIHRVSSGETLSRHIAPKYGVSWRMLQRINRISRPELIRENQRIKVIEGRPKILVDKSRFSLTLFIDDFYVKEYRVGLGRGGRTPAGIFIVDSLLVNADWYPPTGGVIRYGEEGHLIGTRWIGFEDKPGLTGYGIHGTNDPDSIGAMESDGCIRLRNEDVEELYDFLIKGTEVKIMD